MLFILWQVLEQRGAGCNDDSDNAVRRGAMYMIRLE